MNYTTRPPTKLSDLIELAIHDSRALDRSVYEPHSERLHTREDTGICRVCLSGSVLAGTLELEPQMHECDDLDGDIESMSDKEWRNALYALDQARQGHWTNACQCLHVNLDDQALRLLRQIPKPDQSRFDDWEKFDTHLESLGDRVQRLRTIGL